jgi:predicted RNase H-like HicB family nuclease
MILTRKELDELWKDYTIRETIDVKKDLPMEEDCEALRFFNGKTIAYVAAGAPLPGTDKVSKETGFTCWLEEFSSAVSQGETKEEALKSLYDLVKEVLPFEQEMVMWLEVVQTLKDHKDDYIDDTVRLLKNKFNISRNDLFI